MSGGAGYVLSWRAFQDMIAILKTSAEQEENILALKVWERVLELKSFPSDYLETFLDDFETLYRVIQQVWDMLNVTF